MKAQENKLAEIQAKVKAPKGQFNSFGKYHYRSAEDILEAVKQVINPMGFSVTLSDDLISMDGRFYVKSTATLSNGIETYSASAFAREEESKKGMDSSQITGSCSSYSRKYALNGLFALDDTKDSDATNTHGKDNPNAEWESKVNACKTLTQLSDLYERNEQTIHDNQQVINLFTTRKQQLKNVN